MRFARALLVLSLCFCALAAVPPQPPKTAPAKPRLSDAQLESAIKTKFAKSKSASGFTVHVQGGVATIDGKTDVIQRKAAASRMAKTAGAVAVHNRVQVSEAAKQRAAHNLDEGRRRAQVTRGAPRDNR